MTIKRTFTLPDEASELLDSTIPKSQRSKFVSKALIAAIRERERNKLLELLDNVDEWQPKEESVVETIRTIRKDELHKLASNH